MSLLGIDVGPKLIDNDLEKYLSQKGEGVFVPMGEEYNPGAFVAVDRDGHGKDSA